MARSRKKKAAPAKKVGKAAPRARASETEQKASKKAIKKKVVRDSRGRIRDYKKEYKRRVDRAKALGYSKSVARGHPKKGELGRAKVAQMRRAARVPSPGEQKSFGVKHPVSSHLRKTTRVDVADVAGVSLPRSKVDATRRTSDSEKFARTFVELGLGTMREAYSLWFSP